MAILESLAALFTTETAKMTAVEAVKQQIAEKLGTSATEGLKADEHVLRQAAQVENFRVGELPNDIFDKETSEIAEAEVRNSLAEKLGENPSLESAGATTLGETQGADVRTLVETNDFNSLKERYIEGLKNCLGYPETIDAREFQEGDFHKTSVEEVRKDVISRDIITRNESLKGDVHPITGVPFEEKTVTDLEGNKVAGVFPEFDSQFDAQLPDDMLQASDGEQFGECNKQLKEAVGNDPELAKEFTPDQLEQVKNGDTPDGCTWHHNEEKGKMQLVDSETHARTGHTGGRSIWGGGSEFR